MTADHAEASSAQAPKTSSYKYWAFISYSHQDAAVAKRLHTDLERYQKPAITPSRRAR
jgi:hypothetical protein